MSGLYVIDSIVRQSRHQYGPEKDVFGPRFTRNFKQTFQNLFANCPITDKPKIVRVLNLWQLNGVFTADIIQPLLDMANPNAPPKASESPPTGSAGDSEAFVKHLHKLAHNLGILKGNEGKNGTTQNTRFNKKLLAYDYGDDDNLGGDDDDDDEPRGETPTESEPPVSETVAAVEREEESNDLATTISKNLLMNPELLQKLQQIQQLKQLQPSEAKPLNNESAGNGNESIRGQEGTSHARESSSSWTSNQSRYHEPNEGGESYRTNSDRAHRRERDSGGSPPRRRRRRGSHSRSRSRSPRSRRDSRRDSYEKEPRPMSPESLARHKERERRRKGLPPVRAGHVIISSTTLWLGHVPKLIAEDEIKDAFKEFGEILSIDLIPSRGCGYVLLKERSAAFKALQQNSKGFRLSGSNIKMAWAPGKGVKGKEYKDFWDLENGCTYIPYEMVTESLDLDQLAEGGVIDIESLPSHIRQIYQQKHSSTSEPSVNESNGNQVQNAQSLPGVEQVIPPQFTVPPPMGIPPPQPPMSLPILPRAPLIPQGLPPPPIPPHPSSGVMAEAFLASLKNMPPPLIPPVIATQPSMSPQPPSGPIFSNQQPPVPWPSPTQLPVQVNPHLTGSNAQPLGLPPQFNLPPRPPHPHLPPNLFLPGAANLLAKPDDQMRPVNADNHSDDPFAPSVYELKAMERKKLPPHTMLSHTHMHPMAPILPAPRTGNSFPHSFPASGGHGRQGNYGNNNNSRWKSGGGGLATVSGSSNTHGEMSGGDGDELPVNSSPL